MGMISSFTSSASTPSTTTNQMLPTTTPLRITDDSASVRSVQPSLQAESVRSVAVTMTTIDTHLSVRGGSGGGADESDLSPLSTGLAVPGTPVPSAICVEGHRFLKYEHQDGRLANIGEDLTDSANQNSPAAQTNNPVPLGFLDQQHRRSIGNLILGRSSSINDSHSRRGSRSSLLKDDLTSPSPSSGITEWQQQQPRRGSVRSGPSGSDIVAPKPDNSMCRLCFEKFGDEEDEKAFKCTGIQVHLFL